MIFLETCSATFSMKIKSRVPDQGVPTRAAFTIMDLTEDFRGATPERVKT